MFALFVLGFPSPPFNKLNLGWPLTITRRLIMQKASGHPALRLSSHTLYAIGFRFYFTPLTRVLFTVPSRYLSTIGCQRVFSLIQWSGQIHAEFHVHRITWDTSRGLRTSLTRLSRSLAPVSIGLSSSSISHIKVPQPRPNKFGWFRLFRFRSPLLTESHSFSFPGVTEMFHFAPFRSAGL